MQLGLFLGLSRAVFTAQLQQHWANWERTAGTRTWCNTTRQTVRFLLWTDLNLVLLILTVNAVLFALYCTRQLPCGPIP